MSGATEIVERGSADSVVIHHLESGLWVGITAGTAPQYLGMIELIDSDYVVTGCDNTVLGSFAHRAAAVQSLAGSDADHPADLVLDDA